METATRGAESQLGSAVGATTPSPEVMRTLAVTASYRLSEDGRKASLLVGGDGHAVQLITLQVPVNRLHLVSVDAQGTARLKLRPRFEVDGDLQVVRIDASPTYDAPPSVDDLYRAAARNHELERAYDAERTAQRTKRRDTDRERRERVAQAFLGDPAQRAIAHPPPSPARCTLVTDGGRVLFDVATDQGVAKEVPPEAHRRFRGDLRARDERHRQERAAQLARHEEKMRFVAEWIARHGSDEQQRRQAAGVLPMAEAVEAITDHVLAALTGRPRYTRDGVERLREHLTRYPAHAQRAVTPADLEIRSEHAKTASAEEWAVVRELESRVSGGTVVLRRHRLSFKHDAQVPAIVTSGVLVTLRHGPFTLRREYAG